MKEYSSAHLVDCERRESWPGPLLAQPKPLLMLLL